MCQGGGGGGGGGRRGGLPPTMRRSPSAPSRNDTMRAKSPEYCAATTSMDGPRPDPAHASANIRWPTACTAPHSRPPTTPPHRAFPQLRRPNRQRCPAICTGELYGRKALVCIAMDAEADEEMLSKHVQHRAALWVRVRRGGLHTVRSARCSCRSWSRETGGPASTSPAPRAPTRMRPRLVSSTCAPPHAALTRGGDRRRALACADCPRRIGCFWVRAQLYAVSVAVPS